MDAPGISNLTNYGLAGALLAIFLWMHFRGIKRSEEQADATEKKCEERHATLERRIEEHQRFERDTLVPLVQKTNESADNHAEAVKELTRTLKQGSGGHKTL